MQSGDQEAVRIASSNMSTGLCSDSLMIFRLLGSDVEVTA